MSNSNAYFKKRFKNGKKMLRRLRAMKSAMPVRVVNTHKRKSQNLNTIRTTPVLPIKHRSKLIYYDTRVITPTAAASTAYIYSANGLFDPDITGVGHQPMGFDQLMALYEHYTVTNAKVTVSFVNEDLNDNAYVGVALYPDTTVETVPGRLVENGLLKRSWIAPQDSNSKSQTTVNFSCDIAKINGRPKPIIGDDLFRGDAASNPSEQTYFHIFGYNDATANPTQIRFNVIIEYDAVFTEPRKLGQS